jgi:hypothetical protein
MILAMLERELLRTQAFIDGCWVDADDGSTLMVRWKPTFRLLNAQWD